MIWGGSRREHCGIGSSWQGLEVPGNVAGTALTSRPAAFSSSVDFGSSKERRRSTSPASAALCRALQNRGSKSMVRYATVQSVCSQASDNQLMICNLHRSQDGHGVPLAVTAIPIELHIALIIYSLGDRDGRLLSRLLQRRRLRRRESSSWCRWACRFTAK